MKNVTVRRIDGEILYEGQAHSLKEFVQDLVKRGMSLAGSDLRGLNLTHLDLEGGDFSGAWLDGADLRGSIARKSSFAGCRLRGVRADGIQADRSDFSGSDLSAHPDTGKTTSLDGAILTYSTFRASDFTGVKARGIAASSTDFTAARVVKAEFDGATMHNAEWRDATVVSTSFRKADLEPTLRIDDLHMPDRTDGATVAGNNLRKARIGTGNSAFRKDAAAGRVSRYGSWAALTAGVAWAGTTLPLDVDMDMIEEAVGQGAAFIAIATASVLLKELAEDLFKDTVGGWLGDADARLRMAMSRAVSKGRNLASLVAAFCNRKGAVGLKKVLSAAGIPFWSAAATSTEVIVADRRHLAKALAELAGTWTSGYAPLHDVVVIRPAEPHDTNPRAVIFRRDGSMTCIWEDGKSTAARTWNPDGSPEGGNIPEGPWKQSDDGRSEVVAAFIRSACIAAGLPELDFDPETHTVRTGRDGSAVIVRRSDGRLQNPYGPVIVTPSGKCIWKPGSNGQTAVAGPSDKTDNQLSRHGRLM